MTTLSVARERHAQALAHAVQSLRQQLCVIPEVERVLLFGSYVTGRHDLFTDLDLLVVMASSLDFVTRSAALARSLHASVPLDLLVYTPEEVADMRQRPFMRHILQTGKVLYERQPAS